jgi:hypothetical protein
MHVAVASLMAMAAVKITLNEEWRADVAAHPPAEAIGPVATPVAAEPESLLFRLSEQARQGLLWAVVPAWVLLALVRLFAKGSPALCARWLRVLAAIATLCWLLDPAHSLTWDDMSGNAYLGLGIGMLLLSFIAGKLPPHTPKAPEQALS